MHKLQQPTEKQLKLAKGLDLSTSNKSFRVLSAEIADIIELNSFDYIEKNNFKSGLPVTYIGKRLDMPKKLVISTIAKNGFIYFKKTSKYCRPWDIEA